jgi:23S rRNA (uracil1939-C5)-methyltransferase
MHKVVGERELYYGHPQFDTRVRFEPLDFIQVNQSLNRKMVIRALDLLAVQPTDTVLDLFCGLGNFTLPLARQAAQVIGVEGDQAMVERARAAAQANGLYNTDYYACNLMAEDLSKEPWLKRTYDRILLDPPRAGAKEVIPHLGKLKAKRIVYVSCDPATLARDAGELVNTQGYKLLGAGVMDMFPHTAHVESIAVFER